RVNDRGPFAHGRIIDLSRRSTQLLGFDVQGTAKVRVELIPADSRHEQMIARGETPGIMVASAAAAAPVPPAVPSPPVQVTGLAAPTGAASAPPRRSSTAPAHPTAAGAPAVTVASAGTPTGTVDTVPVRPTDIWIQVGSFESRGNAGNLSQRMRSFGPAQIQAAEVAGKTFYRVRI